MSNDVNGRCSESRRSGRVPSHPGLTIVTGMNGHGFGISMGVGEAVAQMLTSQPELIQARGVLAFAVLGTVFPQTDECPAPECILLQASPAKWSDWES